MHHSLSDRIMFDWLYPVCMFPEWVTRKHPKRLVRFVGLLASFIWFIPFLPVLFIAVLICLPLMLWEETDDPHR